MRKTRLLSMSCAVFLTIMLLVSTVVAQPNNLQYSDSRLHQNLIPGDTIDLPVSPMLCDPAQAYAGLQYLMSQQLLQSSAYRVMEQVAYSFAEQGMFLTGSGLERLETVAHRFVRCTFPALLAEEIYTASDTYDPVNNPLPENVLAYLLSEHLAEQGLLNYYVEAILVRSAAPRFCAEVDAAHLTGNEPGSQAHFNAVLERLNEGRLPLGITRPGSFLNDVMAQFEEDADECSVSGSSSLDDYLDFTDDPMLGEVLQEAYMSGWDPETDWQLTSGMKPYTREDARRDGWFFKALGTLTALVLPLAPIGLFYAETGGEILTQARENDTPTAEEMGTILFDHVEEKKRAYEECKEAGGTCYEEAEALRKSEERKSLYCAHYDEHCKKEEEQRAAAPDAVEGGYECPPYADVCGSPHPPSFEEYCTFTNNPDLCLVSLIGGKAYGESPGIVTPWRGEDGSVDGDNLACLMFGACPDMQGDPLVPIIYPDPNMLEGLDMCTMPVDPLEALINPGWADSVLMDDPFWDFELTDDLMDTEWDMEDFDAWASAYESWASSPACEDMDQCQRTGLSAALMNSMLRVLLGDLFHSHCNGAISLDSFLKIPSEIPQIVDEREYVLDPIEIIFNRRVLDTDVPAQLREGRVLVPLRSIFEALAMSVEWIPDSGTIIGTRDNTIIQLVVGSTRTMVNGKEGVLDVPPAIIGGRTMVPVRFIAESTGQDVAWNAETRQVIITSSDEDKKPKQPVTGYTLSVNSLEGSKALPGVAITSKTGHGGTTTYTVGEIEGATTVQLEAPQYVGSGLLRKQFSHWSGAVSSKEQAISFTVDANTTVTAHYAADIERIKPPGYTLSVNSLEGSKALPGVAITSKTGHGGTTSYTVGEIEGATTVQLEAPQYVGSGLLRKQFSHWSGAVSSKEQAISFTVDANTTITAHYAAVIERIKPPGYTLTVSSFEGNHELPGVRITSKTGHGGTTHYTFAEIVPNTTVHLEAPEYIGTGLLRKRFSYWSEAVTSEEHSISFIIQANETARANYVADPQRFFPFSCGPECDI